MRHGALKARPVAVMAALALAVAALGISSAAASATNCPYVSASKLAKALGLKHATAYHVQGPETLEYAAYRFSLCRAVAWSGSPPANPQQAQAKIKSGQGAGIVIKTGEEAPGTPEEIEKWHQEYEEQTVGFHTAGMQLVQKYHGKILAQPLFGAESGLAYEAVQNGGLGVAGLWEDDKQHAYITIAITEGKHKPGRKSLEKIAATAVPGFGV